jgi:hypothetical protein
MQFFFFRQTQYTIKSERYIAVTYWVVFKLNERGRLMCISFPFAQDILFNVVYDRYAKMHLVYWYQVHVAM